MNYQVVIIVGAPRSGTNMLRDCLIRLPGCGTWPCDEINYIWRHGNARHPNDAFTPDMATPAVSGFVRRKFDEIAWRFQLDTVVEKTCANSLRVGFVDRIVPGARYIFITRDSIDSIGSASLRWSAGLDLPYILRKARYVPVSDVPYYASRFVQNRIHRLLSPNKNLAFWGPHFDGMDDMLGNVSADEIAAHQWIACVESAEAFFDTLPAERMIHVAYNAFVRNPVAELARLATFIGKSPDDETNAHLRSSISAKSIGKGYRALEQDKVDEIKRIVGPLWEKHVDAEIG